MSASFVNRLLRATLVLPQGTFPGTNSNTLTIAGFRMRAQLRGSANFTNSLVLDIYGMKQADMSAVTVLFFTNPESNVVFTDVNARAIVTLEASNDGGESYLQIYQGQVQEAQANYEGMPEVMLHLESASGYGEQLLKAGPTSVQGGADVASLAEQLATQMGYSFEDNGVTGQINTPYLSGTLMNQFRQLAEAAGFNYYFDAKQTLIICPANQARKGKTPIAINKDTGLVGYVTLQRFGIRAKVLFDPAIELGSPIELSNTQVPGGDGLWFPMSTQSSLDAITPGGQWFSILDCYPHSAVAEQEQ